MDELSETCLPTTPATQLEFSTKLRDRPCWRCRLYLRWPPWRKHWGCRPLPVLKYIGDDDADVG